MVDDLRFTPRWLLTLSLLDADWLTADRVLGARGGDQGAGRAFEAKQHGHDGAGRLGAHIAGSIETAAEDDFFCFYVFLNVFFFVFSFFFRFF